MEVIILDNKKLNGKELEEVTGGAQDTINIPGLETIGPYAVAVHNMPTPPVGSYSEAERELILENTETVLK